MTESFSDYAVGYGRLPLHLRFQKGQSGNPSGKPGPAKLARQRFQRALWAALEGSPEELEFSRPESVIAAIARKMALDAAGGRTAATRLLLSLLETECKRSAGMEEDAAEQLFTAADLFSLLQGKMQGNENQWLEELLQPGAVSPPVCDEASASAKADPHPKNARTEHTSTAFPETRFSTPAFAGAGSSPQGGGKANPFSLVQGKKQGSGQNMAHQIWSPPHADGRPAAARAHLMMDSLSAALGARMRRLSNDCFISNSKKAREDARGPRSNQFTNVSSSA